jgi:hypothetical protein
MNGSGSAAASASLAAAAAAASSPAPPTTTTTTTTTMLPMPANIRVGTANRPPLVYVQDGDGNGSPRTFDGFLVDLLRLMLDDANVTSTYSFYVPETDVAGGRLVVERNGTEHWTGEKDGVVKRVGRSPPPGT